MSTSRPGPPRAARCRGTIGFVAVVAGVAACALGAAPVRVSGEHDGLTLTADVTATGGSIVVEAVLRNGRDTAVLMVPDQCGRLIDTELERTRFEPEGTIWGGSVQAVKVLILRDQLRQQSPDFFHPRRVGQTSADVPACERPERVARLEPGVEIAERWELPFDSPFGSARALAEVGSDGTRISLEAVEARDADRLEFLDILQAEDEDEDRAGRAVRAELAASLVLDRGPTDPPTGPSRGELFDRLITDERLRSWIEGQPADGWRMAALEPAVPEAGGPYANLRLKLVNVAYERAAQVVARPDGSSPQVTLPGEESRARVFGRRPGTLPPGIALIPEPDYYSMSDDLLLGEVKLPSGRVVVGEYLSELEPLDFTVAPGAYPVHATLARYQDQVADSVSFATLVLSDAPTVRWESAGVVAVDGGSTTIVSVEGRDAMAMMYDASEDAMSGLDDLIFETLIAHDYLATLFDLTPELNLAQMSSGNGDGGYPVYVGCDADGNPTRVVVDFYLLHLAWPGA